MRHNDIILTEVDDGLEFPERYRGRLEASKVLSYVSLPVPGVLFLPGASVVLVTVLRCVACSMTQQLTQQILVSVNFVDISKELWWLIQGQELPLSS